MEIRNNKNDYHYHDDNHNKQYQNTNINKETITTMIIAKIIMCKRSEKSNNNKKCDHSHVKRDQISEQAKQE